MASAAGRVDEDYRANTGRGPYRGRGSDGGPGGQGGELLYKGVSFWNDQYGPHHPEHDRRSAEAHPERRIRSMRELPGGAAAEAAGGGAVGEALYRLPGKDGAGITAMMGKAPLKRRVPPTRPGKFRIASTGPLHKARLLLGTLLFN